MGVLDIQRKKEIKEDKMSETKRNYPTKLHEILQVEPDESFRFKDWGEFWIDEEGRMRNEVHGIAHGDDVCAIINNPEFIIYKSEKQEYEAKEDIAVDDIVAKRLDEFLEKLEGNTMLVLDGNEYTYKNYFIYDGKTIWRTSLDELFNLIKNQDRIVWVKGKPTKEQAKLLHGYYLLGYRYLARDRAGWLYVHENKPFKQSEVWEAASGERFSVGNLKYPCLVSLVSWEDTEPYDIRKALIDNGIEVEDEQFNH